MSIAYNIIKKHDGKITINSTPGNGSEFIILLPLHVDKIMVLEAESAGPH